MVTCFHPARQNTEKDQQPIEAKWVRKRTDEGETTPEEQREIRLECERPCSSTLFRPIPISFHLLRVRVHQKQSISCTVRSPKMDVRRKKEAQKHHAQFPSSRGCCKLWIEIIPPALQRKEHTADSIPHSVHSPIRFSCFSMFSNPSKATWIICCRCTSNHRVGFNASLTD
jgi:hypothetical protein